MDIMRGEKMNDIRYKKIIREIKRKMFMNGMNIKMTAEAIGCNRVNLSDWLNFRSVMRSDTMLIIIDTLNIDVSDVLGITRGEEQNDE